MATPAAQEEFEKMYETLGGKPVHATLAMHWARLIELLYSAERALELVQDPEITGTDLQAKLDKTPTEGVGIVEAQRGTLTHHYWTDEKGLVKKANIIVGTTNNNAPICMSLKKAAQGLIKKGVTVDDGILNMIEMAFRAYDPCFSCATHSLPGAMPMIVNFRDLDGNILRTVKRS
jgi:F420-non-reducing hydrogenase large subunit